MRAYVGILLEDADFDCKVDVGRILPTRVDPPVPNRHPAQMGANVRIKDGVGCNILIGIQVRKRSTYQNKVSIGPHSFRRQDMSGSISTVSWCRLMNDLTYIRILVLWEYFIEITHEFDELGGGLLVVSTEYARNGHGLTSSNVCTNRSVLVYEKPVPAGWSTGK